jgi:hypothetical protein
MCWKGDLHVGGSAAVAVQCEGGGESVSNMGLA